MTSERQAEIDATLNDTERVCAVYYLDENRTQYNLTDFPTEYEAVQNGYYVTHYGKCGSCSSL